MRFKLPFRQSAVDITPVAFVSEFKDPARLPPPGIDESADAIPAREQWSGKAEFLLSCISLSVGLGNVWRFPYLAYANGGGAFLIPYVVVLFLVGKPMYFMEIAFGQFHNTGPVKIWKRTVPFARGIGVAQVLLCFFVAVFYVVIMTWTMFYLWATLIAACKGEPVPWADFCSNDAAYKPSCFPLIKRNMSEPEDLEVPVLMFNNDSMDGAKRESAAQQYFDRAVLDKYEKGTMKKFTLSNLGEINLYLLACLAGSWFLVFISLIKGVKSTGKTVYITSTMPFIALFILLGQGASLPNAVEGIKYFIIPKFSRLLTITTWRAAAEQMFFSLAVAFGSLTMLGSYNKFNNNCYRDAFIVSILDSLTSIVSGLAMFSVLGYLAGELDVGVDNVVSSGPGLAFVTFPEALTKMPLPHLWGILFFIMLFTLGLGSEIGLLESVLCFFCDRFPQLRAKRPWVALVGVLVCFLIGLPFITRGGQDLFDIFNEYAGGISVLLVATCEMISIMWIYGMKRFVNNLREMLGKTGNMGYYFRTAWVVLAPGTLIFILILSVVMYKPLHDPTKGPNDTLPPWADGIGWFLSGLAIIQLPIWAVVAVYKAKGNTIRAKLNQSLWPDYIMDPHTPPMELGTLGNGVHSTSDSDLMSGKKAAYINSGFKDN